MEGNPRRRRPVRRVRRGEAGRIARPPGEDPNSRSFKALKGGFLESTLLEG